MAKIPTNLFILGLLSLTLGPLTGIPGIIMGKKIPDRGLLGDLGYFLCWLFSVLFIGAVIVGFILAVVMPLWRR